MIVAFVIVVITLWRYPEAELVLFHAVWVVLALVALRASSERVHVTALLCFVGALALVVEADDLRTRYEVMDTFIEVALDLPTFVVLLVLARRHGRVLAAEHENTAVEQRRHERQRAFFANASHALRTPITIARGHIEMAMSSITDPTIKVDLKVALDELDRLTRAAERNLRLSVVGEVDRHTFRSVDAGELVRMTVERWKPTADRLWSAEVRGEAADLLGDPEQLTEALDALIENAVLATAAGDSIIVRSEVHPDAVVLSVIDNGCGVEDNDDPQQLFEPFEQGSRRSTHASAGTGLGLAVVRAIAVAHGGYAEMDSSAGAGATVRMTLPRRRDR
jgi:signal transduction histidine kinase